jgi:ribonuclease HI
MPKKPLQLAVVHADESCLRNGQEGPNPGGAGSLIELRSRKLIVRRDVFISSPDTTNNRMALAGAVATFALLSQKGNRFRVVYVSDSEYLIKGIREWVPGWQARGWRRKGGEILNLELWQKLVQAIKGHEPQWEWVRGHAGHPKNEYANHLATSTAREQVHSQGAVPSRLVEWLEERRSRGKFTDYDPDEAFAELESELSSRV